MIPESDRRNPNLSEADLRASQEAADLLAELRKKEGKKALVLIVDDEERKRRELAERFMKEAATRETGYVLSLKEDGESAIRIYQAFREQDSPENPTTVVAVIDGYLGGGSTYREGRSVSR